MKFNVRLVSTVIFATALVIGQNTSAQEYNALAECRSQSLELDQIHACMDSYLDILDESMLNITNLLGESLNGEALVGLGRSQQAFDEYRRSNCLWYLEFSSPQSDAEQIAKNCLADMSRARLQELQGLISADSTTGETLEGFFVFGADRNSFQLCGQTERYWVEGEPGAVDLIQQNYLAVASSDRQLLHAVVVGRLDDQLQAPDGHQGVLQLDALVEIRVPVDSDCSVSSQPLNAEISATDVDAPESVREVFDDELSEQEEPEQQLTAYFGDWIVDCIELSGQKSCTLEVELSQDGTASDADSDPLSPKLVINRTSRQSTFIQVVFPSREIDSPSLIRWEVDEELLGDIVGAKIRVDQFEARLLVSESDFLIEELMPLLLGGSKVVFSVQANIDDSNGDQYAGTLVGLTKAVNFADDFMIDNI